MTRPIAQPPVATPTKDAPGPARASAEARAAVVQSRHRLVVASILLIASAAATMLHVQFAASLAMAVAIGIGVAAILLLIHDRSTKAAEIARLKRELTRAGIATGGPGSSAGANADRSAVASQRSPAAKDESEAVAPRGRVNVLDAQQAQMSPARPNDLSTEPVGAVSQTTGLRLSIDPLRDQWSFRPRDPAVSGPAATIEDDLAMVQRKIKALADEVNAAEAGRSDPRPPARSSTEDVLESSIDALKAASGAMREKSSPPSIERAQAPPPSAMVRSQFDFSIPATAERIASSAPDAPPRMDLSTVSFDQGSFEQVDGAPPPGQDIAAPHYAALARAVETGDMDVLLSPIVGLQSHSVTDYELKVRLRTPDGAHFDDEIRDLELAGGELLALFDAARLHRASAMARKLDARGRTGALLSDVSGPSLTDGGFLETFARMYEDHERIAAQLVLTFSQNDIEAFSESAWQSLGDMNSFGFRFAMDRIAHLDSDFDELARRGFAYVKLDASSLLTGMPSRSRFYMPADACARIAGAGLTIIAGDVDDEATRASLFGFGVLFGQGRLFGGARRVPMAPAAQGGSASEAA